MCETSRPPRHILAVHKYLRSYFFSILDTQVPTALHTSEVTPRSARWVAEDPRRRRGVHRDGLEEAHHPSTDGITFFVRVRPESRSEQLRASVTRSRRRNYHASSVCATANRLPCTNQHDLDCDFARVLRKLSRDSQRSFSSPSFWHYFQVLVHNFLRLRRASE